MTNLCYIKHKYVIKIENYIMWLLSYAIVSTVSPCWGVMNETRQDL